MKNISVSDGEYHIHEKALIYFIARYWKTDHAPAS